MTAASAPVGVPRRDRLRAPLAAAGGAGVLAAALLLHDPHTTGSWGVCPLRAMTGLSCPLCGGLRATADLLHGDLAGAVAMNVLWVVAVPWVPAAWAAWLLRRWRGVPARRVPVQAWWVLVAVVVAFGVARNLPGLSAALGPH